MVDELHEEDDLDPAKVEGDLGVDAAHVGIVLPLGGAIVGRHTQREHLAIYYRQNLKTTTSINMCGYLYLSIYLSIQTGRAVIVKKRIVDSIN